MFHVVEPQTIQFCHVIIVECVENLTSILAAAHEAYLTQSTQLMRYRRFGHGETGRNIADCERRFFETWLPAQPIIKSGSPSHSASGKAVWPFGARA